MSVAGNLVFELITFQLLLAGNLAFTLITYEFVFAVNVVFTLIPYEYVFTLLTFPPVVIPHLGWLWSCCLGRAKEEMILLTPIPSRAAATTGGVLIIGLSSCLLLKILASLVFFSYSSLGNPLSRHLFTLLCLVEQVVCGFQTCLWVCLEKLVCYILKVCWWTLIYVKPTPGATFHYEFYSWFEKP